MNASAPFMTHRHEAGQAVQHGAEVVPSLGASQKATIEKEHERTVSTNQTRPKSKKSSQITPQSA